MSGSRMSGELDSSTVGNGSLEGDRTRRQVHHKRGRSSSGFLLDSNLLPRRGSLRPQELESPSSRKRHAPDPLSAVSNKKSPYPWSHHEHTAEAPSPFTTATSSSTAGDDASSGPSETRGSTNPIDRTPAANTSGGMLDLDRDSLQLVNLALSLNEARRKGSAGRTGLGHISGGRRAISTQVSPSYSQSAKVSAPGRHSLSPLEESSHSASLEPAGAGPFSALSQVPGAVDDSIPLGPISDATLKRVNDARAHFDLFYEYIRLLSSLPPLRRPISDDASDASSTAPRDMQGSRAYNPLQAIRNRKVRFREGSAVDPTKQGWNDVVKVREWVDAVEDTYDKEEYGPADCLRLPPLLGDGTETVKRDTDNKNSSNSKPMRPRMDWIISPAELLSDAAWTEEGVNKSKIVDREGNKIYPDPAELDLLDDHSKLPKSQLAGQQGSLDTLAHSSVPSSKRGRSAEYARVGRGHQKKPSTSSSRPVSHKSNVDRMPGWWRSRASSPSNYFSDGNYSLEGEQRNRRDRPTRRGDTNPSPTREDELDANALSKNYKTIGDGELRRPWTGATHHDEDPNGKVSSNPSLSNSDRRLNFRASGDDLDSARRELQSQGDYLPSIAIDHSPPSSRSSSPSRRHLSRMISSIHDRSRSRYRNKETEDHIDNGLLSPVGEHGPNAELVPSFKEHADHIEPGHSSSHLSLSHREQDRMDDSPLADDLKRQSIASPKESKGLRGIFRGGGKISGLVSNEVSKVGDKLKRDTPIPTPSQSRRPSIAPSSSSEDDLLDDENKTKNDLKQADNRHNPTLSEASGRLGRPSMDQSNRKDSVPNLPVFTSPKGRPGRSEGDGMGSQKPGSPRKSGSPVKAERAKSMPKEIDIPNHEPGRLDSVSAEDAGEDHVIVPKIREPSTEGQLENLSAAYPGEELPMSGLPGTERSRSPSAKRRRRSDMAQNSRSWSISDRSTTSISTSGGLPEKREIERARALLLCSGIKARELMRQAESARYPPNALFKSAFKEDEPLPRIAPLDEHEFAAGMLAQRFERTRHSFEQSMARFSDKVCQPLKLELDNLESLVTLSLEYRVRETAADAENLSIQLNTTTTLAIKQLSDVLDRAVRGRQGRLLWLRRLGFVLLEWVLIVLMWWMWLFVMVFKIFHGIFRGVIKTIRWILWL